MEEKRQQRERWKQQRRAFSTCLCFLQKFREAEEHLFRLWMLLSSVIGCGNLPISGAEAAPPLLSVPNKSAKQERHHMPFAPQHTRASDETFFKILYPPFFENADTLQLIVPSAQQTTDKQVLIRSWSPSSVNSGMFTALSGAAVLLKREEGKKRTCCNSIS